MGEAQAAARGIPQFYCAPGKGRTGGSIRQRFDPALQFCNAKTEALLKPPEGGPNPIRRRGPSSPR
jgi:hypothetical protein